LLEELEIWELENQNRIADQKLRYAREPDLLGTGSSAVTLFEQHRQQLMTSEAPLAARMRPRNLDEFIGQAQILGPGRLLRRAIQADQLASLIFYGPPGTGKTTLAQIIANSTHAHFIAINAVLSGVKEIRDAIATAQELRGTQSQKTILFVDEVHRFNKAQQDALLPWVENGTVILIGATTENPYFEVNKALVSRSRLFQLKPLTEADLRLVLQQALQDPERGYGNRSVQIAAAAIDHLVNVANGDARSLLNALELAVETTPAEAGTIQITLAVAEESIQRRAVLYDKEGDVHFDTISALIKSIRGSDADAALYWLARMVYAGEDPRFIFRRLLILASEDVGLADPNAVAVVNACVESFDRVGMPEGRYPLAQATLYLATAAKSNSVMGFFDALATVERAREAEVPTHLRDPSRDKQSFGHGAGYLYPHAYRDHWVAQQYLPGNLQGQVFYQPSDQGYENQIKQQVSRQREAQLAALVEGVGLALPEVLSFGPTDSATDRWLQRAQNQAGRLAEIRDRLFDLAQLQRHQLVLDLNASTGLLTWEALRQVPEGGVYASVRQPSDAAALQEQISSLPELLRPTLIQAAPADLVSALTAQLPALKFDCLLGRNALLAEPNKTGLLHQWLTLLHPGGRVVLAETIPAQTQRLYALVEPRLPAKLYQRLVKAEEAIYANPADPMVNWSLADLETALVQAGLTVQSQIQPMTTELVITPALLNRWFSSGKTRPSYADQLTVQLSKADLKAVQTQFEQLRGQTIVWNGAIGFIWGHLKL
jgi:putative ATPase